MTGAAGLGLDHGTALAAGIMAVLLFASAIGFGLKLAAGARESRAEIDNLNARVRSWWLIAGVLGIALLAGRTGVTALFAVVAWLALREYVPAAQHGSQGFLRAATFGIVLPLQFLAVGRGWDVVWLAALPLCVVLVVALVSSALQSNTGARAWSAKLAIGTLLCAYTLSHLPALLAIDVPGHGGRNAFLLLYVLLVVQASDVLQYVWGKLAGKRRIAPLISPSKTVEGTVGGILSATALGALLAPITPFTAAESALVAWALAVLGFGGGLLFSAIKRARGIKDWGALIPGHGGVLDRVDSLCLSAPAFYWLIRLGWT